MDIGWGEMLLLGIFALLIFGPEKLPKAASEAGRYVRKLRTLAHSVQEDLAIGGVDLRDIKKEFGGLTDIKNDLRGIADLHPKRIISSAISDATSAPTDADSTASPNGADPVTAKPTTQSPSYIGPTRAPAESASTAPTAAPTAPASAAPTAASAEQATP